MSDSPFDFNDDATSRAGDKPRKIAVKSKKGSRGHSQQRTRIVAGAGLLLIVLAVGVYIMTRNSKQANSASHASLSDGGKKGNSRSAAMVLDEAEVGMPLDELLAKAPPPIYSWRHRQNNSLQQHVWKIGENRNVLVDANGNRVIRIQDNMKDLYFENLKISNSKYGETFIP